jgi:hypothetical protein
MYKAVSLDLVCFENIMVNYAASPLHETACHLVSYQLFFHLLLPENLPPHWRFHFIKKKLSVKKQETPFSIPSSSLSILERNEGFFFLRHVTKKKMKKR